MNRLPVTYETLNERLIQVAPALSAEYQQWVELYEGDPVGPYIVYADLVRHLRGLLDEEGHDGYLTPIFAFIEELAQHPDDDVVTLVYVEVVEGLLDTWDGEALKRTFRMMGPTTRQIAEEVAPSLRHGEQIQRLLAAASSPDRQMPPQ